jgi:CheY-like chemotaxis protein
MSRRPARILCIDDELDVLKIVSELLAKELSSRGWAVEVIVGLGGEMGLRLLSEEGPFDLVITDLTMPGLSGNDLLRTIRDGRSGCAPRGTRPDVPVIVYTAAILTGEADEADIEEFDGCLDLRLQPKSVGDEVERVLAKKGKIAHQ